MEDEPGKRRPPQQTTWVMRAMGSAFDPETIDEYTGGRLHKFPCCDPAGIFPGEPWLMGYWRESGEIRACRLMTTEERLWILFNGEAFNAQAAAFHRWKNSLAKPPAIR